jgi:hypothetical protein
VYVRHGCVDGLKERSEQMDNGTIVDNTNKNSWSRRKAIVRE